MIPGDAAESYVPERGHIVTLDLGSPVGHEQAGRRPALVLSPVRYNRKTGLCVVCPITSKVKGYPGEVPLPAESRTQGVILTDAIRNCDWSVRRARFVEAAPQLLVASVLLTLLSVLGVELD